MSASLQKLYRRKPLGGEESNEELERCLTTPNLIFIGLASMIGAGLYVLTGEISHTVTGPGITMSFFIAGVVHVFSAMCYAEFGARVSKTGSAYVYTYLTVGEIAAFAVGWNLIVDLAISSSVILKGLMGYINGICNNALFDSIPNMLLESGINPYALTILTLVCAVAFQGL